MLSVGFAFSWTVYLQLLLTVKVKLASPKMNFTLKVKFTLPVKVKVNYFCKYSKINFQVNFSF